MPSDSLEERRFWRAYRVRVTLFLVAAVSVLLVCGATYQWLDALHGLELVEAQRDQWQRPADVLRFLELHQGSSVADIGSGVGYFSLKLSQDVGPSGHVFAVDIRRTPLLVLRARAVLSRRRNIETTLGGENDPRLPKRSLDAILVANTLHEIRDRRSMLTQIRRSLAPGGRLVVLDREPAIGNRDAPEHHHELEFRLAGQELRECGFKIIHRDAGFVASGDLGKWWLIVCRQPAAPESPLPADEPSEVSQ